MSRIYNITNNNFTFVSNNTLRDKELTFGARGLLCLMLSRPKDWEFNVNEIASNSPETLAKVRKYIKELEDNSYLVRKRSNPKGVKGCIQWEWYINGNKFTEEEINELTNKQPNDNSSNDISKNTTIVETGSYNNTDIITNKDNTNKENKTKKETNKQLRKQQFEEWYNRYGCFDGNKVTAEKHFMKLSDEQVEKVNRYTDYYLTTDKVKSGYIMYPNNFLRTKQYENPIPNNNKETKTTVDTKIVNRIGKIEMLLDTNNIIYEKDKLFLEETLTDDRYSKYRYILDKIDKAEIV